MTAIQTGISPRLRKGMVLCVVDWKWESLTRRLPSLLTSPTSLQWVPCRGSRQRLEEEAPDNTLPKPGLWLQPDVFPVSTWPRCGSSLAANGCLAFPALPCHRPSHQAGMFSGSSTSLCRGSFASGFPAAAAAAAAPARMFCNEPQESIHSGKIREWTVLASRGLGERAVTACRAGVGAGQFGDSPFLGPCGTLASKLFICLSACPSGLEGLACSLQFPKGLPTAGQLEISFFISDCF